MRVCQRTSNRVLCLCKCMAFFCSPHASCRYLKSLTRSENRRVPNLPLTTPTPPMPRTIGSKNRVPASQKFRKPYGSQTPTPKQKLARNQPKKLDNRKINRREIEAQSGSVTNVRDFKRWLSDLSDTEHSTYSPWGSADQSVDGVQVFKFTCNRGRPPRYHEDDPHRICLADRYTACEVRLICYVFEPDLKDEAPVYVVHVGDHNHSDGKHQRLSMFSKEKFSDQLRSGVPVSKVLKDAANPAFNESDVDCVQRAVDGENTRSMAPTPRELYRIKSRIAREEWQLHPNEALSMKAWCRERINYLLYQDDCAVSSSDTRPFALAWVPNLAGALLQVDTRTGAPGLLASTVVSIDATHNTTKDVKKYLFSIVAESSEGHGVPIAFLLASSKSEETISRFLNALKVKFPDWRPKRVLTDCDD